MHPTLQSRGKWVVATGVLFLLVGSVYENVAVVALGSATLAAVMTAYLAFFPVAVLIRQKQVELSWWIAQGDLPGGALTVGRPFELRIALRNHGRRPLWTSELRLFTSRGLEVPRDLAARVPSGHQVELICTARSHRAAYLVFHGALLTLSDALGLFDLRAYFPNPIAVRVFPRPAALGGAIAPMVAGGAAFHRVGPHTRRQRGASGELRELRDHSAGDPFRHIAWKASARRRKLMVRELETEIVLTHQIAVDIGSTMRAGDTGRSRLDFAIELGAALARHAIDSGDRVGLVTYESRIFSEVKAADGHHHYLRILDRLMETQSVVDEDLTWATNGELVAQVARYLLHQEAIDVRIHRTPAIDDPIWENIQAGPDGELYNLVRLGGHIEQLLDVMARAGARAPAAPSWAFSAPIIAGDSPPVMARMRLFCRLRGIELLPRSHVGGRIRGLSAALERIAAGARADFTVLISDLEGVLGHRQQLARALVTCRRAGTRVACVIPTGASFLPEATSDAGKLATRAFLRAEEETFLLARRVLGPLGVTVVSARPEESLGNVLGRLARGRGRVVRAA